MRIALGPEGNAQLGRSLPGRGAWLCAADGACLDRALRTKALHRALRAGPGDTSQLSGALEALRTRFPAAAPDARD